MTAWWHMMENTTKHSCSICMDFKLCAKLVEFTRFTGSTSTHAEINEDFSLFPHTVFFLLTKTSAA